MSYQVLQNGAIKLLRLLNRNTMGNLQSNNLDDGVKLGLRNLVNKILIFLN